MVNNSIMSFATGEPTRLYVKAVFGSWVKCINPGTSFNLLMYEIQTRSYVFFSESEMD